MKFVSIFSCFGLLSLLAYCSPNKYLANYVTSNRGNIFFDSNTNGAFIPFKENYGKDIVCLKTIVRENSLIVNSYYDTLNIEDFNCYFRGAKIVKDDSVIVMLKNNRLKNSYPNGFVHVRIKRQKSEKIEYYNILGNKNIKVPIISTDSIGVSIEILQASSKTTFFDFKELRDTLIIHFDYLTPREMERYTYFNDTISLNK